MHSHFIKHTQYSLQKEKQSLGEERSRALIRTISEAVFDQGGVSDNLR